MNEERTHRLSWPPESCPDWCAYGTEHADDNPCYYEDRIHVSESVGVLLSADETREPQSLPAIATVVMEQHYREVSPRIIVGGPGRDDFYTTPAEAEELAVLLLTMAAAAKTRGPVVLADKMPEPKPSPTTEWIRRTVDDLAEHESVMTDRERQLCTTLLHGLAAAGRITGVTR